jgi:hypothetical protein
LSFLSSSLNCVLFVFRSSSNRVLFVFRSSLNLFRVLFCFSFLTGCCKSCSSSVSALAFAALSLAAQEQAGCEVALLRLSQKGQKRSQLLRALRRARCDGRQTQILFLVVVVVASSAHSIAVQEPGGGGLKNFGVCVTNFGLAACAQVQQQWRRSASDAFGQRALFLWFWLQFAQNS